MGNGERQVGVSPWTFALLPVPLFPVPLFPYFPFLTTSGQRL